jgi:putative DNA primase/helicase
MGYDVKAVKSAAAGRWPGILQAFGVDSNCLQDRHGACPSCGGTDRFRFDDKTGNGDWYCNQCGGPSGDGGSGDGFMLLQRVCRIQLHEAINEVGKWLSMPEEASNDNRPRAQTMPRQSVKAESPWRAIRPVPASAPALQSADGSVLLWNPKKEGEGYTGSKMRPALVTAIRDTAGELHGYVLRCEFEDGKITPQASYCVNTETGEERWCMKGIGSDRPVIGSDLLAGLAAGSTVLLVEGEKTREAALRLVAGRMPVLTWVGGSNAVSLTDWSCLRGLKVVMWPDADDDGIKAANGYAGDDGKLVRGVYQHAIANECAGFRWVHAPRGVTAGWDLADAEAEGWDWARVSAHIKTSLREGMPLLSSLTTAPPLEAIPVEPAMTGEPDDAEPSEAPPVSVGITAFVKPLGHNAGNFYYWSAGLRQVVAMGQNKHTKNGLLSLAPSAAWKAFFPKGKSTDFDMDEATDWMMEACRLRGVYDPHRVRGRGAWLDDQRVLLHLGDRLIVDGVETDMATLRSVYVYQSNYRLPLPEGTASKEDIRRLEAIAKRVRWEVPGSAYLLLGFLTLAPICGAMKQRPGIWIAGASGSGKSTVMQEIIKPLLGDMLHFFQGATTTEPGIRQTLNGDAMPVAIDEFEVEDKRHAARVQAILELARGSYSDDGAKTAKGSSGGLAQLFVVRSMFAMSSINVGLKFKADSNRIAVLDVRSPDDGQTKARKEAAAEEWDEFSRELKAITPALGRRLLGRTVSRLQLVRDNVATFVRAAGAVFGSQRLGDTYGTLLGGAWSLLHDEPATHESATAMIQSLSWDSYTESAHEDEAESALSAIMQVVVPVENSQTRASMAIGELVRLVSRRTGSAGIYHEDASVALGRYGVKVADGKLVVANKSRLLERALQDTPFAINWKNYLRRLAGAVAEGTVYFAPGVTQRATSVPMSHIVMED